MFACGRLGVPRALRWGGTGTLDEGQYNLSHYLLYRSRLRDRASPEDVETFLRRVHQAFAATQQHCGDDHPLRRYFGLAVASAEPEPHDLERVWVWTRLTPHHPYVHDDLVEWAKALRGGTLEEGLPPWRAAVVPELSERLTFQELRCAANRAATLGMKPSAEEDDGVPGLFFENQKNGPVDEDVDVWLAVAWLSPQAISIFVEPPDDAHLCRWWIANGRTPTGHGSVLIFWFFVARLPRRP